MDIRELVGKYKEAGFILFPLQPNSKEPVRGCSLSSVEKTHAFSKDSNIGLFTGSENGFLVIDADSDQARDNVIKLLYDMKLMEWVTVVRTPKRKTNHFWMKVFDVPDDAQAYYKLPPEIGDGELRVRRPAYVLAPGSKLPEGEYEFIQGGIDAFAEIQPPVLWSSLQVLTRVKGDYQGKQGIKDISNRPFRANPPAIRLFEALRFARTGQRIPMIDYRTGEILENKFYPSRSEAEFALVMHLVINGWSAEQIEERFSKEKPMHYITQPDRNKYLDNTYKNAVKILSRQVA
jgi:hypothetical protein